MSTATLEAPIEHSLDDTEQQEDLSQLVSFRLADEEYGIDIMQVQEIIMIDALTLMPQVPSYVRGLINLRGHVIPIFDLRIRFGLAVDATTEHSRIIVLNVNERTIGIMVDAVNEVLRIAQNQIEPPPGGVGGTSHRCLSGLVKLDDRILLMLNIEEIGDEPAEPADQSGAGPIETEATQGKR